MRRLLHAFVSWALIFSSLTPVCADEPQAPFDPNQEQGDFVTLPQMQAGQTQNQNDLSRAATLQNQMAAQAVSSDVSFDQRPTYPAQIGVNDDFSARFQLTNNSPAIRNGYVMIGFTPSGTTNTREFYRPITLPPGTTIRDIVITNAQLRAGGVMPGNYQLSFLAYNEQDQKIGSGFFGNPFSFGSALPAIGAAPTYSPQINPGQNIVSTWTFSNSGDVPATVTLLTVVTPAGTTNSREFYRTGVSIPSGGGTAQQTVTAAQLSAAGFGAGRYLLSFVAFDSAERRIGEFFGKPLTIGSADVHVAAPSIPSQIGAGSGLTVDFETTNNGNFSDPLTALLAFTPVGSTDPSETIEMYVSGFNADPGSTSHRIFRPAQQLRDRGINPGRWLVTMTAFNAQDQRLEIYYGHLLTIGDIRVTLPARPVLPSSIGASGDYSADFTFVNNGDTADKATALLVLTPVGATDPAQSKEFYFTGLVAPPGSSTHTATITAARLANAGITPGNWLVTATGFDGAEVRLQNYFGNPLEIGNVEPSFTTVPTYRRQIPANGDFLATFQIGNTGDAPGRVTLVTSITPAGSTDPAASKEFSLNVTVPPGGGTFDFEILNSALVAAGIQPGDQVVSFVVLDAAGNRVGEFFGNLLRIGDASLTVPAAPAYSDRVGSSEDFTAQWTFGNSGPVSADVEVLTVFTKVGTTNSIEVYRTGQVPANGGGTVNILLTPTDRAAAGITAGDYTLSFIAFDANGNRIAEFFGKPLAIGEASLSLPAQPSYTDTLTLSGDFGSSWTLGNSGSTSGTATLVASVIPVGGTDSDAVEFRKVVTVAAGGETVSFAITNAELDAAGITGGRYRVSFVAFDPSGTRLGEFFAQPLTIGTITPSFSAVPSYDDSIPSGSAFSSDWLLGNTGDAPDRVTLVVAMTPAGSTTTAATQEFSRIVALPAGGLSYAFTISSAELSAAGISSGDYVVTFAALDGVGNRIGQFNGNLLRIGEASLTVPASPAYSDRIGSNDNFTAQWTFSNSGPVSADVQVLTVFTKAGTTNSIEIYRDGQVPANGGTVNVLLTAADRATAGITDGDYTLSFVAFDEQGNRIAEFFGKPLSIGEGSPSFTQAPSYSSAIGLSEDLVSTWRLDNSGSTSSSVTLTVALTPAGSAQSVEFAQNVSVPPAGSVFEFRVTAAQRQAQGLGGGRYLASFVASDANGNRLGSFFGNPLTVGTIEPSFTQAPTYTDSIGSDAAFESDWTLGNTGNAPDQVTLVLSITPAGSTDPSATKEFSKIVTLPAGGAGFEFDLTNDQLDQAGIGAGQYTVTFTAIDGAGNRVGQFAGNPLTVGSAEASFSSAPVYTRSVPENGDITATYVLGNTGDAAANVTMVMALTPAGSATTTAATNEFSRVVSVPAGGGSFDFTLTAAERAAAGMGPGDYTVTFAALDGQGNRIGQFPGNLLRIGEASLTVPAEPAYSDRVGSSEDFTAQWTFGNSGPVSADVEVLTVFTRVGTTDSIEVYRTGLVPAGGGTVNILLTPVERAAAGIPAGDYAIALIAFDANGNRIAEFFGNPLFIGESQATFGTIPEYTGQLLEGRNFESDWTLGNSAPVSGVVTLVTSITPAGTTQTVEFSHNVSVPPGGGTFHQEVTVAELQAAGFGPGSYTVSFVAVDGAGNRLGEFLGNPLEVIPAGTPIGFLLGQQLTSGARSGLVESWEVLAGDPNESLLADRACSYDQAIAAISLLFSGQNATARNILDAMVLLEAGTGRVGSMYSVGPQASDFSAVYTGTNAWFGDALATYELVTRDSRYRAVAERIAEALLSFRDPSTGLLRGGLDADGNALPWISTEHNLDAYSFLDDLAFVTGDSRWRQAADDLSAAIDTHLWSVSHFLNGFGDDLVSLDVQAYGGIYWLSRGDVTRADIVRTFIEENLKTTVDVNGAPVTGYAPYRGDTFIWVEGSIVVGILDSFLGRFDSARAIAEDMDQFRVFSGGLGYASSTQHTSRSGADELFPAAPNVASTAWGLILQAVLEATPPTSGGESGSFSTQAAPQSSVTPNFSTSVTAPAPSVNNAFLPPTQGQAKISSMSLYSQAAQQGFFNIAPGLFQLTYLSSGKRLELSGDSFFSVLLEFLFG